MSAFVAACRITRNMADQKSPGQAEDDRKDKIRRVARHAHDPDAKCNDWPDSPADSPWATCRPIPY
jgi:hypothetical protein